MTYKMSNSRYSRETGFHRCNQSLTVGAISGTASFGGLVLMWNQTVPILQRKLLVGVWKDFQQGIEKRV